MTEEEKAQKQIEELIEAVQRGDLWAWRFSDFLMKSLKKDVIKGLAKDFEDSEKRFDS